MSVRVSSTPISTARALAELHRAGLGGVVVFEGIVRPDRARGGRVRALNYETHRSVALDAMRRLAHEVGERTGASTIVLWHRVGVVPVGEVAVIVGAAAPHRRVAFRAVGELIDRVKTEIPLWKSDQVRSARRPRRRLRRRDAR